MKKVLTYLLAGFGFSLLTLSPAMAGGGNLNGGGSFVKDNVSTDAPGGTATNTVNVAGNTQEGEQETILDVVKRFINYVLGLLAFIALIMLLFGGFNMITAAGDEGGYKKGFTILKNAALGLGFIAVAWLIVSLIFFVLGLVTQ